MLNFDKLYINIHCRFLGMSSSWKKKGLENMKSLVGKAGVLCWINDFVLVLSFNLLFY